MAFSRKATDQRIQVATQLDKLRLARPEIREYLPVALIHHHPFLNSGTIGLRSAKSSRTASP